MGATASQITSLMIVYSTVYSDADQRKHQSSASLAFVRGIHRGPVKSPHKRPVKRKMFPFDDVIMSYWYHKMPLPQILQSPYKDCGLWLVLNNFVISWTLWGPPPVLMSMLLSCKSANFGWNKIESRNTYFKDFFTIFLVSAQHWKDICL